MAVDLGPHPGSINRMVFPDQAELDLLCEKYGQQNVERTMIYITQQRDPKKDLWVNIRPTAERVEKILDAVHGEFLNG
jgi:hypothetical protein